MSLNGEIGHVSQYRHNCLFCDETHRYLNDLTKGGSNSSCLEKHNTHAMLASPRFYMNGKSTTCHSQIHARREWRILRNNSINSVLSPRYLQDNPYSKSFER